MKIYVCEDCVFGLLLFCWRTELVHQPLHVLARVRSHHLRKRSREGSSPLGPLRDQTHHLVRGFGPGVLVLACHEALLVVDDDVRGE